MNPQSPAPTLSDVRTRLRTAGLRATGPRIAVLSQFLAQRSPSSHADIAQALAPTGLDRATVYRNLMDLTEAGILTRTDLGDHVWRFELRASASHSERAEGSSASASHTGAHPHFICSDCGEVACLPDVQVAIRAGRRAPRSLQSTPSSDGRSKRRKAPAAFEVQIRGKCDDCA